MARTHFGTDGVRGIVGETLTLDLVERLGRAATTWAGRGRVFVGRDTRGSGPALEEALVRGIVSAGGIAVLGGVLPTPAVALLAQDLGVVLSASHNPPEYNGVKLFDAEGHKLSDADEEAIEALLDAPASRRGRSRRPMPPPRLRRAHPRALRLALDGLRIAVDCANGAYSAIAPGVFEQLGAEVTTVARPRTGRTSTSAAARRISACCRTSFGPAATTSGSRSTVTATACSPSTRPERRWTATRSSPCSRSRSVSTPSR